MSHLAPGTYEASIVSCGFRPTKTTGTNRIFVTFETKGSESKRIDWYGNMQTKIGPSGKSALMISIDQLLRMGFTNNWEAFESSSSLADCFDNPDKVFEIVVEDEDYNGKTYSKIKWVNDPEKKGSPLGKMGASEAASLVKSMNLKGLTLQVKSEMNAASKQPKAAAPKGPAPKQTFTDAEIDQAIPF